MYVDGKILYMTTRIILGFFPRLVYTILRIVDSTSLF